MSAWYVFAFRIHLVVSSSLQYISHLRCCLFRIASPTPHPFFLHPSRTPNSLPFVSRMGLTHPSLKSSLELIIE